MNTTSIIVGTIIIALCVLPFGLMIRKRYKNKKEMFQQISSLVDEHKCKINKYEFCGDFVIGIDSFKKFVFFYKKTNSNTSKQFINLNETINCRVNSVSRLIGDRKKENKILEKLELCFIPKNKNTTEKKIEFYNVDNNLQINDELNVITNWEKIINDCIKN